MGTSIILGLYTIIVCGATWFIASRRSFRNGVATQKAMTAALARFDEENDLLYDSEAAARHERAVKRCGDANLHAALHGLTFPPAIDLRDDWTVN